MTSPSEALAILAETERRECLEAHDWSLSLSPPPYLFTPPWRREAVLEREERLREAHRRRVAA